MVTGQAPVVFHGVFRDARSLADFITEDIGAASSQWTHGWRSVSRGGIGWSRIIGDQVEGLLRRLDTVAIWAMLAALGSAVAAFISWMTAHTALKTNRRQHSASLLADLTSGEVASARDRIGNWLYGDHKQHSPISKPELIHSYYVVAWALERLAVGRTALGGHAFRGSAGGQGAGCEACSGHPQEQAPEPSFYR